jgi:hypothetical protein
VNAGLFYGLGAAVPLVAIRWLPVRERVELAFVPVRPCGARVDGPVRVLVDRAAETRMVLRNLVIGAPR